MNSLDKKPNLDIKYLDEAMRETVINWNDETEKSMLLYFPECELFVSAYPGTGDNLLSSDYEDGYNDYLNIESFYIEEDGESDKFDGGMLLFSSKDSPHVDVDRYIRGVFNEIFPNSHMPTPSVVHVLRILEA